MFGSRTLLRVRALTNHHLQFAGRTSGFTEHLNLVTTLCIVIDKVPRAKITNLGNSEDGKHLLRVHHLKKKVV